MLKKMNNFIAELEGRLEEIQTEKDRLEDVFNDKSERWQESANGDLMSNEIDCLGAIANEIENLMEIVGGLIEAD